MTLKSNPSRYFAIFIALLLPFILLMGGVKILLSFNYPGFQYGLIGFPEDSLGYSRTERTQLAAATLKYLNSERTISDLTDLKDSQEKIVYTREEVSHLQDVKHVIDITSIIWYVICGLSLAFLFWILVTKSWAQFRHAFFWGAVLTILLMIAIVVLMILNFDALFEKFHAIFFPQGNWTFSASSGLIRLFPLPLWVNAFILEAVFCLLISFLLILIFWPRKRVAKPVERIVPMAIPSSKTTVNIPSMAKPVNPFLSEEDQPQMPETPVAETETVADLPSVSEQNASEQSDILYPPEGGTGLEAGSADEHQD